MTTTQARHAIVIAATEWYRQGARGPWTRDMYVADYDAIEDAVKVLGEDDAMQTHREVYTACLAD